MSGSNPLVSRPRGEPAAEHPMMLHAKAWRHVNSLQPDEMTKQLDQMEAGLPVFGALAGDPNVTAKDVIKAAAGMAADGKIDPSEAVAFISAMPSDPKQIQPWLKARYAAALSASVHIKAAQMKQPQLQASATPQAQATPPPSAPSQAPEAPL